MTSGSSAPAAFRNLARARFCRIPGIWIFGILHYSAFVDFRAFRNSAPSRGDKLSSPQRMGSSGLSSSSEPHCFFSTVAAFAAFVKKLEQRKRNRKKEKQKKDKLVIRWLLSWPSDRFQRDKRDPSVIVFSEIKRCQLPHSTHFFQKAKKGCTAMSRTKLGGSPSASERSNFD